MNYADRLEEAVRCAGNPCLVGLDPHEANLPEEFAVVRDPTASRAEKAKACADFLCSILEVCVGKVPAVKPQSAFFEIYGADGAIAWERVVRAARRAGLIVIGDVKRGDIDTTAKAYARAFLEGTGPHDRDHVCDAITVNPYLGSDSITPFLESCKAVDAGIYVLVRTSNKHSALFQDHGTPKLYEQVARAVDAWGAELVGRSGLSSIGAVVGATHPSELAALRKLLPRTPFLIPGYGAQGASASDLKAGFGREGLGAICNASRSVIFAYEKEPWKSKFPGDQWAKAVAAAAEAMKKEINAAVL